MTHKLIMPKNFGVMRRFLAAALAALALILFTMAVARADTPDPDEAPSLHDIRVYRHLLEDDDFLAIVPYIVTYETTPDLGIDKTFVFRLLDTDGETELGAILAYPYYDGGYGEGIVSFYFSADEAPTWDEEYFLTVTENPSAFETPQEWVFNINSPDYSVYDTQEENQQVLRDRVIIIADELSVIWPVTLTEESEVGTVLSAYGEAYFRNAVKGLQTMCPALFYVQISNVDTGTRSWSYIFAQTLANTYNGTWVMSTMTGFAGLWGLDTSTAMSFAILIIAAAVTGFIIWKLRNQGVGYLFLCLTLVYGSLNGWFSPILHALFAFFFVFIGGMVLFLNRA